MRVKKNKAHNFCVAYILTDYPSLTKTFIDREILVLRSMGVGVSVFSLRRRSGLLSDGQENLLRETHFLSPIGLRAMLAAHGRFLLRQPRQYVSTFIYLLTRPHPTLLSHRYTLVHFNQGIYLAYLLEKSPVDHIHAHFLTQAPTIALIASRLLKIPYSVTVHASRELYAKPMMVREKLADAKFIATCTQYNEKYLAKLGKNLFDHKLKVIYHGLDASHYRRKQPPLKGKPVILSVGQLRARKGFHYLIEACRLLKTWGVNFECRIVGEGPLRGALEAEIEQCGLSNEVILCGALPEKEVMRQYEQATLFALPAVMSSDGDRDGIPNVILEAMAMELPVVSTAHSAIPEVIVDGVNGLLVPTEDAQALAKALELLLGSPQMRKTMGQRGRQTVLERFDPQTNASLLLQAFTH